MQWSHFILALTIGAGLVSTTSQSGVVVTRLATPTYPPLARQTAVQGDVSISLGIHPDGSIESAVVISGHPLLQQAALDSAQRSQYECRGCTEPVTPFSMSYSFQIQGEECGQSSNASSSISQKEIKSTSPETEPQNHVLIVAQRF